MQHWYLFWQLQHFHGFAGQIHYKLIYKTHRENATFIYVGSQPMSIAAQVPATVGHHMPFSTGHKTEAVH